MDALSRQGGQELVQKKLHKKMDSDDINRSLRSLKKTLKL
jgi:hypothetical protein